MFDNPKFDVLQHSISVHTIGCFFRLFANRVIPTTVKHLAYMDTDVVIMANLEELWRQVEATPDALFHWGRGMCSGFMVLNVPRAEEIWTLAQASPMKNISDAYRQNVNDPLVLMSVNVTYLDEVAILEDGWDDPNFSLATKAPTLRQKVSECWDAPLQWRPVSTGCLLFIQFRHKFHDSISRIMGEWQL